MYTRQHSEQYLPSLRLQLIKYNGGIPVYRETAKNTVDQVVERIKKSDKIILAIAPEGTRKRAEKWKTGFYYIALKTNIPILLMYMDYKKKEVGYFDVLRPSGDLHKDLEIIENYYKDVKGKHLQQFNPKIY